MSSELRSRIWTGSLPPSTCSITPREHFSEGSQMCTPSAIRYLRSASASVTQKMPDPDPASRILLPVKSISSNRRSCSTLLMDLMNPFSSIRSRNSGS